LEGKNVRIAELAGGCVCCSLIGEFEAAVEEVITTVNPDRILVETTGVAEPDAILYDVQENIPQVWLDGVVTLVDGDQMVRFPDLGKTTRMQIEQADVIVLNKTDLLTGQQLEGVEERLKSMVPNVTILRTERCRVEPQLLFGVGRSRQLQPPAPHQHHLQMMTYYTPAQLSRTKFEAWARAIDPHLMRVKGFVQLDGGSFLFNWVRGRYELEPFAHPRTELAFIGPSIEKDTITKELDALRISA
jgi:G3E family GTPase